MDGFLKDTSYNGDFDSFDSVFKSLILQKAKKIDDEKLYCIFLNLFLFTFLALPVIIYLLWMTFMLFKGISLHPGSFIRQGGFIPAVILLYMFFLVIRLMLLPIVHNTKETRKKIKELLSVTVQCCVKQAVYKYEACIDIEELNNIKMMRKSFGKPLVDDYIEGRYKGFKYSIAEVRFGNRFLDALFSFGKTKEMLKADGDYALIPFKGILFTFAFPKANEGFLITRNRNFLFPINIGQEVRLEDLEYNKIYKTSGDDQIEARVLLQPAFMEKLKNLNKKGQKVACCFQDSKVYVAIQTNKNMFEFPFWRSAKNIEVYKKIINQIQDILSIIDTLQN